MWFHGLQLTLHEDPDQVVAPGDRAVRHFGVTLPADDLAALLAGSSRPTTSMGAGPADRRRGHAAEQTKAMIADPSGNAIELKSYADPDGRVRGLSLAVSGSRPASRAARGSRAAR